MEETKVIVDSRERDLTLLDALAERKVRIEFQQLPVGDYVVSDRVCIERKTVHDLENSILNARLFDQLSRLSASFAKPVLIIEGDSSELLLASNVLFGTIVAIFIDYNVQVIGSSDMDETAAIIAKIAEREQKEKGREPRSVGLKRAYTNSEWQLLMLSSMPGIGPKLAKSLIRRFRTIRNVAHADVDELMEVEKVGKKKAETIFSVLNEEFKE